MMWPGVIIHELSHLAGCLLTFTRVVEVKLFAPSGETLGYVSHVKTSNPVKNIIISIAPLFGVSLVMVGIIHWLLPATFTVIAQLGPSTFSSFSQAIETFRQISGSVPFDFWQTYIALYFLIALSSHAAPSIIDLKHAAIGICGLIILIVIFGLIATWTHASIPNQITTWIENAFAWMSHVIIIAGAFALVLLCFASIPAFIKKMIR